MPASGPKETMSEAELAQRSKAAVTHGVSAVQRRGLEAMTANELALAENLTSHAGLADEMGAIRDAALWLAWELMGHMEGHSVSDTLPAIASYTAAATKAIGAEHDLLRGKVDGRHNVMPRSGEGIDPVVWERTQRKSAEAALIALCAARRGYTWLEKQGIWKNGEARPLVKTFAGVLNAARLALRAHASYLEPSEQLHAEELTRIDAVLDARDE